MGMGSVCSFMFLVLFAGEGEAENENAVGVTGWAREGERQKTKTQWV